MKHLFVTLSVAALAVTPVFAAKRITSEVTDLTANKTEASEILLDADRLRINDGNRSMMFLSKGGNRFIILDKAKNEYQEIDQATMDQFGQALGGAMAQMNEAMAKMSPEQRAMMEQMMKGKLGPAQNAAPPSTTYAAKGSATVAGFRCTNYEATKGGQKVEEICAAQPSDLKLSAADFQVFQKMQEYLSSMTQSLQNSPLAGMLNNNVVVEKGVDGFPVQRTQFKDGKAVSRTALKSIADATFSDGDFSIGSAKKVEINIPGAQNKGKAKGR